MKVNGNHFRTIWVKKDNNKVIQVIDQNKLPHSFEIIDLETPGDFEAAIRNMNIRGAGLIGATAGFGMYSASLIAPEAGFDTHMAKAAKELISTRPTAKNLEWAVSRQLTAIGRETTIEAKRKAAFRTACEIADEDADFCRRIGEHGLSLLMDISKRKGGEPVNILTHCNAGWLAFVDYGSATSPVYLAHDKGIPVKVWVDETRPRNQGAQLTAWELGQHGVPYDLIVDNAGGHLMQHNMVDIVIVGADRVTARGDTANKIGTYLKALSARDNGIPFYVALPSSTFDWEITDGISEIPIEERDPEEIFNVNGTFDGELTTVRICPENASARNYGFDVTPSRLITGLITERGVCTATEDGIKSLFT